jgi:DNA helicase-2/ATP-dependent DNA helicase PcrA
MRYAADLHLHSRHAKAVSKDMTLPTMAAFARRKGIDVLGTGDCLQPEWLAELEENLIPAEPGWFALWAEGEEPGPFPGSLRLVLSTEVSCAPPGKTDMQGIHHLVYFSSFACVKSFRAKAGRHGDLSEGRPTLRLSSRELLELSLEQGCHLAPAHVMNPYFSSLGSQAGHRSLEEIFGDLTPHLLAVEMGLTSIPPMCRRVSSLDAHALFANSDAHSPEKIGRECTLLETAPGYDALFAALRSGGRDQVIGCLKFSIHRAQYFLNWCSQCEAAYPSAACPEGHGRLPVGSRDWLEHLADRVEPVKLPHTPRFRMYVPLRQLLSEFLGFGQTSRKVALLQDQLLRDLGHERHILTAAPLEDIARASSEPLARAIVAQRDAAHDVPIRIGPPARQAELF